MSGGSRGENEARTRKRVTAIAPKMMMVMKGTRDREEGGGWAVAPEDAGGS